MGRRIPLRSLSFALALSLAVSAVVLLVYDAHGARVTLTIVAPIAIFTVLAGEAIARWRPGGLRGQFTAIAALGMAALAITVALFVNLMFVSSHDALMTIVLVTFAAALVFWIARPVVVRALADIAREQQVRLDELVHDAVEAMQPSADAGSVAVRADLSAPLHPSVGNHEQLQRVLFNLIQNAIRHTPADGSVVVRAEPAGDGVEIEVADTGAGIAADDRDRIFEPFFRGGEDAARSSNGAGLGLAISRAIVEAHGGRIWLEDADTGTCVRFRLPVSI